MISKYLTSKVFHPTNASISTESVYSKIFHFEIYGRVTAIGVMTSSTYLIPTTPPCLSGRLSDYTPIMHQGGKLVYEAISDSAVVERTKHSKSGAHCLARVTSLNPGNLTSRITAQHCSEDCCPRPWIPLRISESSYAEIENSQS